MTDKSIPPKVEVVLAGQEIVSVPLSLLGGDPNQPRKMDLDDPLRMQGIEELMGDFRARGQITPILFREVQTEEGVRYVVVDGERRLVTAKALGWQYLAGIKAPDDLSPEQIFEIQAVACMAQEKLRPTEVTQSALRIRKGRGNCSLRELEEVMHLSAASLSCYLALENLDPKYRNLVDSGGVPLKRAAQIARQPFDKQAELFAPYCDRRNGTRSERRSRASRQKTVTASLLLDENLSLRIVGPSDRPLNGLSVLLRKCFELVKEQEEEGTLEDLSVAWDMESTAVRKEAESKLARQEARQARARRKSSVKTVAGSNGQSQTS